MNSTLALCRASVQVGASAGAVSQIEHKLALYRHAEEKKSISESDNLLVISAASLV